MSLVSNLFSLIVLTIILSMAFSFGQIILLYMIFALFSLILNSFFVDFVNNYIVIIGGFINKKMIGSINDIIIKIHKTPGVGSFFKVFLKKIPTKGIICLEEPFGFQLFGFKTNKGCENLLKKYKENEKKKKENEKKYKENKENEKKKENNKNANLYRSLFYVLLIIIVIFGFSSIFLFRYR